MSSPRKKSAKDIPSIESTMKSIEKLMEKLENDETSLDESLKAFEEGITLTRNAQRILEEAEQKVRLLLEVNGDPVEEDPDFGGENE